MRNVPDHYSGATRNIIVREVDYAFWESILDELEREHTSNRVAAVGSPGIGKKSTTVAFAIRLLLKQSKTVLEPRQASQMKNYGTVDSACRTFLCQALLKPLQPPVLVCL